MTKKKSEIKPGKAAEVVDQETQVSKVQVLSTDQMDNTTILPDTIIVDPSVEVDPIKEGPVLDEPLTEKEQAKQDEALVISPDSDNVFDDKGKLVVPEFNEKAEAKLAGDDEAKEPTRYGAGKEVIADQIEDVSISRHYPPPAWGDATGGKNEYPR